MQLSKREQGTLISTIERIPTQLPRRDRETNPISYSLGFFYSEFARYVAHYFAGKPMTGFGSHTLEVYTMQFDLLRTWYEVLLLSWDNLSSTIDLPFNSPFEGLQFFLMAQAEVATATAEKKQHPSPRWIYKSRHLKNKYNKKSGKLTKSDGKELKGTDQRALDHHTTSSLEKFQLINAIIEFARADDQAKRKAAEFRRLKSESYDFFGYYAHPNNKGRYFPLNNV
jgi:hypothetical protein